MDTFVLMNKFKNSQTTTFAHWEMLLSTTTLPSLVVIVKHCVDIWTKLLTGGQKLASSLRMDLDGELVITGKR